MPELVRQEDGDISLYLVATILLRNRRRIAAWALVGAVLAGLTVLSVKQVYRATASFMPQGARSERSTIASLAGQFGVSIPTGEQSQSPDFYEKLLKSRVLLLPIAHDTFVVRELGNKRMTFVQLAEIDEGDPEKRDEKAVATLASMEQVNVSRPMGIVEVVVMSPYRSVSLAIVDSLLSGVQQYNERARRGEAAAERQFVEGRLAIATRELRETEDRLEHFLETNRDGGRSPELMIEHQRIQRDVVVKQQVVASLTQSFEDARIREVRDTPAIVMFEPANSPTVPEPRGRLKRIGLGFLIGMFIGIFIAVSGAMLRRQRQGGDPDAVEFALTLGEMKGNAFGPVRWVRKRVGQ